MEKELKINKNGGFEVEILEIYEEGNQLRVKTRCPFGEDNLGLSLHTKYIDRDGIPKWKKEIKKLLELKYGKVNNQGKLDTNKKDIFSEHKGILNIEDLDTTKKPK